MSSGPFVIKSIDNGATPPHFDFATKAAPGTLITLVGDGGEGRQWRRCWPPFKAWAPLTFAGSGANYTASYENFSNILTEAQGTSKVQGPDGGNCHY